MTFWEAFASVWAWFVSPGLWVILSIVVLIFVCLATIFYAMAIPITTDRNRWDEPVPIAGHEGRFKYRYVERFGSIALGILTATLVLAWHVWIANNYVPAFYG
jgi:hypothetical protein